MHHDDVRTKPPRSKRITTCSSSKQQQQRKGSPNGSRKEPLLSLKHFEKAPLGTTKRGQTCTRYHALISILLHSSIYTKHNQRQSYHMVSKLARPLQVSSRRSNPRPLKTTSQSHKHYLVIQNTRTSPTTHRQITMARLGDTQIIFFS